MISLIENNAWEGQVGFSEVLGIARGVTAIIGGGGKTTLMLRLAAELLGKGSVIICATAKMFPPQGIPLLSPTEQEIAYALQAQSLICVGNKTTEGKLTLPLSDIPMLMRQADYVLCEADGSKGRPLKAHAQNEPVIPEEANKTILVMGIDGIGKTVITAAHRPELYAKLLNVGLYHTVTPLDAANVARIEALHDIVYMNKVETGAQWDAARDAARYLACPVAAGALHTEGAPCLLS